MYLKSIEVQGFKSFAHKLKFEFNNGITGIVGPNGSGKSNVCDAVRWVFGEQSAKQLRSSNMQDVIFSGTVMRKAQSYASVAITLDNSDRALKIDYDEVTVTRRLYRSGESEYMLNGSICRLRDVQELFYDTGIGKEGYSIIGQTQVDKILSGKPEDRRELFDEAAGIVKYKKRKNMALRKLENEHANMLRISDILLELERQVGPLQRQSENAKKYLVLRDELKRYDINAFLLDQISLSTQLKKTVDNLDVVSHNLTEKENEEESLKNEYSDVDELLQSIEGKLEGVRSSVTNAQNEKNAFVSRIAVINEQIHTEEINADHILHRIQSIDSEIADKNKEMDQIRLEKSQIATEVYGLQNEYDAKQNALSEMELKVSLYKRAIEEQHGDIIEILNEKSEISGKLQHYATLIEQNGLREKESKERLESIQKQKAALEKDLKAAEEKLLKVQSDITEKEKEKDEIHEMYDESQGKMAEIQRTLNDLSAKYQLQKSKADALRNLVERYEGYGNAVRRIMDVRKSFKGIEGVIADLIHVESEYQTAIETALGGNIQNIVTDTDITAKRVIAFLKENKAGRATFLPLNQIQPRNGIKESGVLEEDGVIDIASKLVDVDEKYDLVVDYLLSHFLVVDTIDHALDIAKKYRHTFRIVTVTGELLSPGGSITGGAFKNSSNLLGRTSEIEELEKNVQGIHDKINQLNKKLNQYKQSVHSSEVELEDLDDEIQELRVNDAKIKAELDSSRRGLSLLELEEKEETTKLTESEAETEKAKSEQQLILETVQDIESRKNESKDSGESAQSKLQASEEELSALKKSSDELHVRILSNQSDDMHLSESLDRISTEIQKLNEEKTSLSNQPNSSEEIIEEYRKEIENLSKKVEGSESHFQELEGTLQLIQQEKDKLTSSQRAFFDKKDALSKEIAELTKEQVRLESQKERLEEKMDSETEYLWNEYQLTPTEAEQFKDAELTQLGPVKKHAYELKNQISSLGSVNVNAIEQYKEVGERYEFMKKQHDDLVESENQITAAIDELDEGMRKQFKEKFGAIQVEFDKVFKELFGGGQGTLALNEDADLIDSDISIIAQPPGKKLGNMMQLSNGEKALTAISLIFAIQNLKPSPFCMLDEIEAALDESNVGRFTGYLRKLSDNTQFIVITHRRGTMVAADRLYGITMQEKGISTLVSVNMVEQDLDN